MTTRASILLAAAAVLSTGCYEKHLIFQAEVVSMTKTDAQAAKALKAGPEVSEKWCMGDEPVYTESDGSKKVGLADQVIYKAQGGGKKADFITDVRIFRDSDGCALLTGKPARL